MHVVAHVLSQGLAPVALRAHMLREGDRQRRYILDREAALVWRSWVGLVELLAAHFGRWPLVHSHFGFEAACGLRSALDHNVAADLALVVAEAVIEPLRCRQQQQ